jgi:hypothetical protein
MPDLDWWTTKGRLKNVMGIKSDLRDGLLTWIRHNYVVEYEEDNKRANKLVNCIIDTFLDAYPSTRVKVKERTKVNKSAGKASEDTEYEEDDYYADKDMKNGDILSFTRRCVSEGYILLTRRSRGLDELGEFRSEYRGYDEYNGFNQRPKGT